VGRALIVLGVLLLLAGLVWQFGEKLGLQNLPGNFTWRGERYVVHFPVMTSIILSLALSALLWLFNLLRR
jgi:hypothetical protein